MNIIVTITYKNFYRRKTIDFRTSTNQTPIYNTTFSEKVYRELVGKLSRPDGNFIERLCFILADDNGTVLADIQLYTPAIQKGDTISLSAADICRTLDYLSKV